MEKGEKGKGNGKQGSWNRATDMLRPALGRFYKNRRMIHGLAPFAIYSHSALVPYPFTYLFPVIPSSLHFPSSPPFPAPSGNGWRFVFGC